MSFDEMQVVAGKKNYLSPTKAGMERLFADKQFVDVNYITTVRIFLDGSPAKVIKSFTSIKNDDRLRPKKHNEQPLKVTDDGVLDL